MNINDLRPAREFALQFGVKAVVYGKPGSGKTPICVNTAPRPVYLASEPGMLTLKNSQCPTYPAFSPDRVDEFMRWFLSSSEAKNFDTLVWDSVSQSCERKVADELSGTTKSGNEAHGKRAYGKMASWMYDHLSKLYFAPNKHVILIAKLGRFEENGISYSKPYFPGIDLNVRVPHLYDLVTCLGDWNIPGVVPTPTKAFMTRESLYFMGRDRSGNLNEFEPPDLTKLFAKCTQQ